MTHTRHNRKYSPLEIEVIRKKKIGQIKIAQKQLGLDDETYRALLLRVTDKNSCANMNLLELNCVVDELVARGFKVASKKYGAAPKARPTLQAMISKIEAILTERGLHWNYAHAIAKRKFGIEQVHWLDAQQCHSIVASLQIYANRQKKKEVDHESKPQPQRT